MPIDLQAEIDNLVKQGNARDVVPSAATSAPDVPSQPPQLNDYIQRSYDGDDGSKVNVYSTDGKRKAPELFDQAAQHYAETGKDLKGFIVLQPGMMDTLRSTFESVNQPLQKAIPAGAGQFAQGVVTPMSSLLTKLGLISPEHHQAVMNEAGRVGSGIGHFVASQFDTPEKAMGVGGTIAGAALSGGTSIIPQMAITGLSGAMGYLGGGAATGNTPPLQDVILFGGSVAGAQGFGEALKYSLGMATSALGSTAQMAERQVTKGVADLVKAKYGVGTGFNSQVVEMLGSNPADVAKLTNIGLDAIITNLKAAGAQLRPDLMQSLPRTLSTGAQRTMRTQLRDLEGTALEYLQNIGNKGADKYFRDGVLKVLDKLEEVVIKDFNGMSKPAVQKAVAQVNNVVSGYVSGLDAYKPGATLLKALKESSADTGFNAQAFQRTLQNYQQIPGSMMAEAGNIARRGAPFGEVDTNVGVNLPIGKIAHLPSMLRNLSLGANVGTKYAGKVEGTRPTLDAFGSVTGSQAIRDFLNRERK